MLAGGDSITRTAAAVGVSRQTIYNWLAEPEFSAEVDRIRSAVVNGAIGRLRGAVELAVGALCDVASNPEAPEAARVQAAREILSRAGVVATTRVEVGIDDEETIEWLATLPEPEETPTH